MTTSEVKEEHGLPPAPRTIAIENEVQLVALFGIIRTYERMVNKHFAELGSGRSGRSKTLRATRYAYMLALATELVFQGRVSKQNLFRRLTRGNHGASDFVEYEAACSWVYTELQGYLLNSSPPTA